MAKRKKVKELKQVHGKDEQFEPTSLDQIWGDEGLGKYKTLDKDKYEQSLNNFTKADLQKHAAEVGVVPVDNRNLLIRKLLVEFKKHVASYRKPSQPKTSNEKPSEEVLKILREGR